jgi:REP element-mobilizing transposase RayT
MGRSARPTSRPGQGSQLALPMPPRYGWGGARTGAGRKPGPRPWVPRVPRPAHAARFPLHVTLRAARGVPSLRGSRPFAALLAALRAASRARFRVVHFSVQDDHVHLLVEAASRAALTRGAQGLAVRTARAVNRALGRAGKVWGDRYHARALRTPREVRNALAYVLGNWHKHDRRAMGLDPCSSAAWFEGWRHRAPGPHGPTPAGRRSVDPPAGRRRSRGTPPVAVATTWLLRVGWRRHGLLDPHTPAEA